MPTFVFAAADPTNGTELWITDGTAAGTKRGHGHQPGGGASIPEGFTALGNGRIVFGATDGTSGAELWVTDGTAAGTLLLDDVFPGAAGSSRRSSRAGQATSARSARAGRSRARRLDGDGKGDIVWRDGSGHTSIWEMNGGQIGQGVDLGALSPGAAWQVAGVGDFDGDGKSDLLSARYRRAHQPVGDGRRSDQAGRRLRPRHDRDGLAVGARTTSTGTARATSSCATWVRAYDGVGDERRADQAGDRPRRGEPRCRLVDRQRRAAALTEAEARDPAAR